MFKTEETLTDTKGVAKLVVVSPAILSAVEQPITTRQLAQHLQLTDRTIATYRAKRLIPFWRLNSRNIRYRLSDVERALSRNS